MKKIVVPLGVMVFFAMAGVVWRYSDPSGESSRQATPVDPEQAAVARTLERTLRESRTGVEVLPIEGAPVDSSPPQDVVPDTGLSSGELPEGLSLGTYLGPMQRAPLTSASVPEPSPDPNWFDAASASDAILDQAARTGRAFTFAVLRVSPGVNLQTLDSSLAALGSQIEGSTGPYVRVRVPAERGLLESIAGLAGVLGVAVVPPGIKADEAFVREMLSRSAGEQVPVYITLMAPDTTGEWRQALSELGVVVGAYDRDLRSYTVNLPAAALAEVLAADFVLSVEPVPIVTANHDSSVPVMGVDGFRQYDFGLGRFSGITGSGIAVGVLDTGLNTNHMDISHGRTSICGASFIGDQDWDLWLDLYGHGTHVFGTIAGAGRTDPLLAGIAPGLSHLRMGKVLAARGPGSEENVRRGMDFLSRPTGCSWRGVQSEAVKPLIVNMSLAAVSLNFSGRGVGERKLDSVVHGHSQLYVVAQANSGLHGFSNYGTAKNSLAVGAVEDSGIIAWFSSHGPTADGRLAPNVVGTGVRLTSSLGRASVSGHVTLSGTSMAAPSVAGVAALLMEARPEFQNRPALARARLMASAIRPHAFLQSRTRLPADNTDGPGAFNNLYGLGLVSARTTLFSRDAPGGWLIGSATSQPHGDSYEYIDIEVPEGAGRLDVVLTWDEQPADTLTRSVLNNLDLWADQGADCAEEACGEHASRSEVDNVEWLLIEDPVPGTYRIKVVPVEIYGESSTAAVAWKILRDEPVPQLHVVLEDTSDSAESEYITVDVTVDADRYVASGTTLHISCGKSFNTCGRLFSAYEPYRNDVYREDGLNWTSPRVVGALTPVPIPIGEVAAGTPKRVQLRFVREEVVPDSFFHVTASSWNAMSAGDGIVIGDDARETDSGFVAPANDSFAASERIEGAAGATPLDLVLASREPGEPLVSADSRTLWYMWEAPVTGLFRFRLHDVQDDRPMEADFALFTGSSVVDLDIVAEKTGSEISFATRVGVVYHLRIASEEERLPSVMLEWESADTRPANDDFAYAQVIEGERGSIESTNEGATLESSEFLSGAASTVWYEWTAPADGWWQLIPVPNELGVYVFVGEHLDQMRLVSVYIQNFGTWFRAGMGETYRIAVAAPSAEDSGARFSLWWSVRRDLPGTLPENDLFENAIEVDGAQGRVDRILVGERGHLPYSVEPGEPLSTGISTGWWQWTAPSDGRYTWRMDGDRAFRLTFFTGDTLENLQFVGSLNGGSAFVLDATGGRRYWIAHGRSPELVRHRVFSFTGNAFTWGPTPSNDSRMSAVSITGAGGSSKAMLSYATTAPSDPADTVGTDSLWWRWRAPESGWQRFWVQGHSDSTILSIYPDNASTQAIAHSERSFIANGRVEVHMLVAAGQEYDIRIASRPGIAKDAESTLRWESSDPPLALSYKREVRIDSLADNPLARGFRLPHSLAISDDGNYLFSSAHGGVFAFLRDPERGEIALAYRAPEPPGRTSSEAQSLRRAHLWWNAGHGRLFALTENGHHGFALPEEGSTSLPRSELVVGGDLQIRSDTVSVASRPDGRHLYVASRDDSQLHAYRVDSAALLTRVQTVSAQNLSETDLLIVPDMRNPVDMALSSDGHFLYLAAGQGLFVFSRDTSSGRLEQVRKIPLTDTPDSPFQDLSFLKNVSLDGTGSMLFVSGERPYTALRTDFAVFDVSTDPSTPTHLDTLTGLHYETDSVSSPPLTHQRYFPFDYRSRLCNVLVPHAGHPAVDVFCTQGFAVVAWNPATRALEVADFAVAGSDDRFGNRLPAILGSHLREPIRIAQSPDGNHVYRTTDAESGEHVDAIHLFERARAMTPVEGGEDAGPPPDSGDGEVDRFPNFRNAGNPGEQEYTAGTAIDPLTLPEASGGNGTLSYSLMPPVPGLTFDAAARRLTGTPSSAGSYEMMYIVTDEDGDTDTLDFTITVSVDTSESGSLGECYVGLLVGIGQRCTYPGTTDEFSVNVRGRGSFLGWLAGIRIRINNETINGRVYDFWATHQGDGVWRIDRVGESMG